MDGWAGGRRRSGGVASPNSGYSKLMSLQPRRNPEPVRVNESSQFRHVLRRDTCAAPAKLCLCGAAPQWNMAVYGCVVWLELHTAMLVSTAFADFLSSPRVVLPRAGWFIECSHCNGYTVEGPMAQITHSYYVLKAFPQQRNKKVWLRWIAPFIWHVSLSLSNAVKYCTSTLWILVFN